MKNIAKTLLAAATSLLTFASYATADQKPVLTVYTYDSFVSDWGPGPKIKEGFEATCKCELNFVAPGDAAETFNRLRLEGTSSDADVIVGLDSNLVAAAKKSGLFTAHGLDTSGLSLPIDWDSSTYLPFDWGHFAFVYNSDVVKNPPKSFEDLLNADESLKIVIQDPRSSTPGLGLLLWVKDIYGDKASEVWSKLAPRIVTVTKGWSEAYGMFLEGQAQMVLSYTTSPAYHIIAEEKTNYHAAAFSEGHYVQLEVSAVTKGSDQPELAKAFLEFLSGTPGQAILPTTNWMYPARMPKEGLPKGFDNLIKPTKSLLIAAEAVPAIRKEALNEWLEALSK